MAKLRATITAVYEYEPDEADYEFDDDLLSKMEQMKETDQENWEADPYVLLENAEDGGKVTVNVEIIDG